jgi:murein DD-endopeptidase MepM/ murein hydrolase activator NlpD
VRVSAAGDRVNRGIGPSEEEQSESFRVIRALMNARRSARVIVLAAVLSMVSMAVAVVPALAADPDPTTTTTTVPPDPTTTTVLPPDTTTTTLPTADTTTTTLPTADTTTTTTPPDPGAETSDLSPDETLEPEPAFVSLSSSQLAVLQQLQSANDTVATRHFALVALDHQVAAAKDELKAARARENAVVEGEFIGLLRAPLDINKATAQAPSALDALWRSFESERKSAWRARVQAQPGVVAQTALVDAQTQVVADATAARDAAESAAISALGSDAGLRPQADGMTATLAAAQAGQGDPTALDGFAPPIPGARLGSPFGIRIDPLTGGGGFHPGLDFDAVSGTPIHAAAGVVVMAGDCGGYGNCVVIDHGWSLATVYAHQRTLLTHVGDQVDVGQVIGLVGSTGKSTGPHLHFEVRLHGIPIDALPTLTA